VRLVTQIVLVSIGSSIGGLTRWSLTVWAARWFGTAFPWGTLFINLTGSLILGWFSTILSDRLLSSGGWWMRPDDLRLLVAVGFCGAFTTFSTFEYESHNLLRDGDGLAGASYVAISVFLGLVAIRVGVRLAHMF
jgi:CrcB protein